MTFYPLPLLLLSICSACAPAYVPAVEPLSQGGALETLLDSIVTAELRATGTPGASIAVVVGDSVVYRNAFGIADVEANTALTVTQLFRIASTTKMMTAAAVLSSADAKVLSLDEPIGRYMPELHPAIARLTLRDLLRHTAGMREGSSYFGPSEEAALRQFVRAWSDTVLFTVPGDIYSYSNLGYSLAGAVLEAATGKPYADAMATMLFDPLAMSRSTLRPLMAMTYQHVQGHDLANGKPYVVRPFSNDVRYWPGGSVFTNVDDFARFVIALLNGGMIDGRQALPKNVVAEMLRRQTDVPAVDAGENAGYTFGLIERYRGNVRILQHGGARVGFGSVVRIIPDRKLGIIILTNRTQSILPTTLERVTDYFIGDVQHRVTAARGDTLITAEEAAAASGQYVNARGELELQLFMRDDALWLTNPGQPAAPATQVYKTGSGLYRVAATPFTLTRGRSGAMYLVIAGHALRKR